VVKHEQELVKRTILQAHVVLQVHEKQQCLAKGGRTAVAGCRCVTSAAAADRGAQWAEKVCAVHLDLALECSNIIWMRKVVGVHVVLAQQRFKTQQG
jgi:hypothetical protein